MSKFLLILISSLSVLIAVNIAPLTFGSDSERTAGFPFSFWRTASDKTTFRPLLLLADVAIAGWVSFRLAQWFGGRRPAHYDYYLETKGKNDRDNAA